MLLIRTSSSRAGPNRCVPQTPARVDARAEPLPDPWCYHPCPSSPRPPARRSIRPAVPPRRHDLLARDSFTFTTDLGDVDILGTPSGTRGYDDLRPGAEEVDIDGLIVPVA
jgi:hypothetical protein